MSENQIKKTKSITNKGKISIPDKINKAQRIKIKE